MPTTSLETSAWSFFAHHRTDSLAFELGREEETHFTCSLCGERTFYYSYYPNATMLLIGVTVCLLCYNQYLRESL
jgi:hypothetical protein